MVGSYYGNLNRQRRFYTFSTNDKYHDIPFKIIYFIILCFPHILCYKFPPKSLIISLYAILFKVQMKKSINMQFLLFHQTLPLTRVIRSLYQMNLNHCLHMEGWIWMNIKVWKKVVIWGTGCWFYLFVIYSDVHPLVRYKCNL